MTEDWTAIRDRLAEIVLPLVYASTVEGIGRDPAGVERLIKDMGLKNPEELIAKQVYGLADAMLAERRKIFQAAADEIASLPLRGTV